MPDDRHDYAAGLLLLAVVVVIDLLVGGLIAARLTQRVTAPALESVTRTYESAGLPAPDPAAVTRPANNEEAARVLTDLYGSVLRSQAAGRQVPVFAAPPAPGATPLPDATANWLRFLAQSLHRYLETAP